MYLNRKKTLNLSIVSIIFCCCLAIIILIVDSINQFKIGSQFASIKHISHLSHLLVNQQSKLFSLMLAKNISTDELIEALDNFTKEDFVLDATLYTTNGIKIGESSNTKPLLFNRTKKTIENDTQQIVEPIFSQQKLYGFLRVTFDIKNSHTSENNIDNLFHLLYGKLIVLFIIGGLFISSFYPLFYKGKLTQSEKQAKGSKNKIKPTTRFYSNRRRLYKR